MCQEIMAPQVEHGEEEALAPTEADETQQQPEKSRCVHADPCLCADAGSRSDGCLRTCLHEPDALCFLCECVHECTYPPAKDLTFFVFHVRRLGLGDSILHRGGMSWKTKLRRLNTSSKYFVIAYLAKLMSRINCRRVLCMENCHLFSLHEYLHTYIWT